MATGLNVTGDAVISGNLRLGGTLSPPVPKDNILALAELQPFTVPLTDFRVWDAMQTALPGTPAADDLGLVGGTFGTATPSLRTQDLKALGATSNRARVLIQLPWEYVAGRNVKLRLKAGMITTVADTTATVDVEAYKLQADPDDAIGSDLVTTAATTINSLVFADIEFSLNASGLSAGDILDVRISTTVTDAATGTAVIGGLSSVKLLADVR